jgi:pSer/pThr/pTyr-binding forkhead associated (FHA) protein
VSDLVWVEQAPREGWRQPVTAATIGREACDIVVPDPQMSRRHAAVRALDSGVAIEDLGSKNGTFVNDRRIDSITELKEGDRVRFGKTVWELQAAERELSGPPREASGAS